MKRNYWPLFFIGIFSFVFCMIIWTIYSAVNTPVHEDKTFLKSYHDLDKEYNDIVKSNNEFLTKYDFVITINEKDFELIFNDMFLSQRVIEEKSKHKDVFKVGSNIIVVQIKDKATGKIINDVKMEFSVYKPTNDNNNIEFNNENKNSKFEFELPLKGNWNISGVFKIKNDTGYFFVKSNAI
jgi:hypothetical protein